MRKANVASRTRTAHWVPRRIYYVLAYLKRWLTPGKPCALSNAAIKAAIHFGSEGEVSQIMRWLAGDVPTMGRWAYGVLNTPQIYRFITRERMPSGGYLITLLAVPELIDPPKPEAVQLSFLDDPSMIPLLAHQDALEGGSSTAMRVRRVDRRHQDAADRRLARDQHEDTVKESNSSSVGASSKNDWGTVVIDGIDFLPTQALEKAGVTPQIFQAADRKIQSRREYDRPAQVRILFNCLLNGKPIYSASEIAARTEDMRHDPAATASPRPDGNRARRRSHADRGQRQTAGGVPNPGRDAEFAAQLAEFDRIARERHLVPRL